MENIYEIYNTINILSRKKVKAKILYWEFMV